MKEIDNKANTASVMYISSIIVIVSISIILKFFNLGFSFAHNEGYFLSDDSFYYLEVAKNFFHGHFFTFDRITTTNGFQYLWMFLLVFVYGITYLLGIPEFYIHFAVVVNAMSFLASGAIIFHLLSSCVGKISSWSLTLSGMLLCSYFFMNLMESHLVMLLYLLLALYILHAIKKEKIDINCFFLAALSFLLFLSRVDTLAIPLIVYSGLWWRFREKALLKSFSLFALMLAFYVVINLGIFGVPFPISGEVKAFWSELWTSKNPVSMWNYFFSYITKYFFESSSKLYGYVYNPLLWGKAVILVISLMITTLCLIVFKFYRHLKINNYALALMSLAGIAYLISQLLYYSAHSYIPRLPPWYLSAGVIITTLTFFSFILILLKPIKFSLFIKPVLSIALVITAIHHDYLFTIGLKKNKNTTVSYGQLAQEVSSWINTNTNPHDVIGVWAAGEIAYRTNRRVINLEGLVGDKRLLKANRENRLFEYINKKNVKYVIQWLPKKAINKTTGYPIKTYKNPLVDLRTRLIYQNEDKFELIKMLPHPSNKHVAVYFYYFNQDKAGS